MNFNPVFPMYPADVREVLPIKYVTYIEFIDLIRNSPYKRQFERIEYYSKTNQKDKKSQEKRKLVYFTPCVHTDGKGRGYKNITKFTGLMPLDFDNLSSVEEAQDMKDYIFHKYPEVLCCFLSPSKLGVKALVYIPISTSVQEYKSYMYGMAQELQYIKGFDATTQNPTLPLFVSTDTDIYTRTPSSIWRTKGIKLNDFNTRNIVVTPPPSFEPTSSDAEYITKWYEDKISEIYTNGHPQVLSASVTLGGLVGWGYLTLYEACSIVENAIPMSSYLHKDLKGYINAGKKAVKYGMSKPIELWTKRK